MSDEVNFSISELRHKQDRQERHSGPNGQTDWTDASRRVGENGSWSRVIGTGEPQPESSYRQPTPSPRRRRYDPWRLLDALTKRCAWIIAGAVATGALAWSAGLNLTQDTATVQLIRRETPNAFASGDALQPQGYSQDTLFGLMRSPEVLRRVSAKLNPPVHPQDLAHAVKIQPQRNPDFVNLSFSGKHSKERLAEIANLFAAEVVQYTREKQAEEAGEINAYLTQNLAGITHALALVSEQMIRFSRSADVLDFDKEVEAYVNQLFAIDLKVQTARISRDTLDLQMESYRKELAKQNPLADHLQSAHDELITLLSRGLTEEHPQVQMQRAKIGSLERTGAQRSTNSVPGKLTSNSFAAGPQMQVIDMNARKVALQREIEELEVLRTNVQTRVKGLSEKAVNYAVLKGQHQSLETIRNLLANRQREAQLLQENALGYFRIFALATPDSVNSQRRHIIIALLTGLGAFFGAVVAAAIVLLTELTDSRVKTANDLERVTALPIFATLGDLRRLSPAEQVNWAFRTLTLLQGKLNSAPDQSLVCGFISSRHGEGRSTWINLLVSAASQRGLRVLTVTTRPSTEESEPQNAPKNPSLLPVGPTTLLNKNALAFPAQVIEQFNDPEAQPVVHIPLPGWVWNLDRRKQWQSAVAQWCKIDNLVLLIELPPACEPESVLLAENLPQVIWLAESGKARADETRLHLETLRHARCNVVGAVLNREPRSVWQSHLAGWMQRLCVVLCTLSTTVFAADTNSLVSTTPLTRTNLSFGLTLPGKRAPWQEKLTLGPGDTLDLALFGFPELTRTNLVIGPDGRLSYLQAQNIPAAGLTIDELRARLDQELRRFYAGARTVVVPVAFSSKKYYVLGKVVNRGVFTLDRPLTIVEAVARARGLETAFAERNTVEAADLSRSFLVRQGKRLPLDFARLFLEGDLSQNILLEPEDFLYFPAANLPEIYVLGEVTAPGIAAFTTDASVLSAITSRGGFSPKAHRQKVLVVRGSLDRPETFIVNTADILAGRTPDFKLQAKDIIYVNARPWAKVEELLDLAGQAFVEASITAWTGNNVGPVISRPFAPKL